jgi:hypothetical protein
MCRMGFSLVALTDIQVGSLWYGADGHVASARCVRVGFGWIILFTNLTMESEA